MHSGYSTEWHPSFPVMAVTLKSHSAQRTATGQSTFSTLLGRGRSFPRMRSRSWKPILIERWRRLFKSPLGVTTSNDVAFARTNVVSLFHRQNEDTAIADLGRPRRPNNGYDRVINDLIRDNHIDHNLRPQCDPVLGSAVYGFVPLLPFSASDLSHRHACYSLAG